MILTATFKSKGREYSLPLDTDRPDRNYDDENYAEWFVTADDGRIIDVTVWKDGNGKLTRDCVVEVYANIGDFEDERILDKNTLMYTHIRASRIMLTKDKARG